MKEKICGIYKIVSPSNRVYIGQSTNVYWRWKTYRIISASQSQTRLHRSFLKHGIKNHKFEILQVCELEQLNKLEVYYIALYNSFNSKHGLNLRGGGNSGGMLSQETKERVGMAKRGKKTRPCSEETKLKISRAQKGISKKNAPWNKGKKLSYEQKKNIIIWNAGKKLSEEQKRRLRGWKHTEEAIIKIGNASRGNGFASKIVLNTETGIYYNSATEAAKIINMPNSSFAKRLSGFKENETSFIYV